jgi:hypothetical protein
LHFAQIGKKHEQARALHGFGAAGIPEFVDVPPEGFTPDLGNTFAANGFSALSSRPVS